MKRTKTITLLLAACLSLAAPSVMRADLLDGVLSTDASGTATLLSLPKMLVQYAEAQVELKKLETQLLATSGIGEKILNLVGNYFGVDDLASVLTGDADKDKLLVQYADASQKVRDLESMIRQEFINMQRVENAVKQIANGTDILSGLRATFNALSPYVEKSSELVDIVDWMSQLRNLNTSAYTYFYNTLKDPDVDLWYAPGEIASFINRYSYYSGKLEDEYAFIVTQVLNPDNSLSQAERRKEIIEAHKRWNSTLSALRAQVTEVQKKRIEAQKDQRTRVIYREAFTPKLDAGEDGILGSPAELKDLVDGTLSEDMTIDSVETTQEKIADIANPLLNFVSAIIGLIALIFTVVNAAKVQKGEPQRQDALFKVWVGAFISILAMQIVRLIFFA